MTIDISRLSDLEISARLICEAPLCHGHAIYLARYTYALDGEDPRTYLEPMCTWHALELADEIVKMHQSLRMTAEALLSESLSTSTRM